MNYLLHTFAKLTRSFFGSLVRGAARPALLSSTAARQEHRQGGDGSPRQEAAHQFGGALDRLRAGELDLDAHGSLLGVGRETVGVAVTRVRAASVAGIVERGLSRGVDSDGVGGGRRWLELDLPCGRVPLAEGNQHLDVTVACCGLFGGGRVTSQTDASMW